MIRQASPTQDKTIVVLACATCQPELASYSESIPKYFVSRDTHPGVTISSPAQEKSAVDLGEILKEPLRGFG
jgi:hypothetical protein